MVWYGTLRRGGFVPVRKWHSEFVVQAKCNGEHGVDLAKKSTSLVLASLVFYGKSTYFAVKKSVNVTCLRSSDDPDIFVFGLFCVSTSSQTKFHAPKKCLCTSLL